MSVSFGSLNVDNGLASRLLRAIGYEVREDSDGSMEVEAMMTGIEVAKGTLSAEDAPYLGYLEEEVRAAKGRGEIRFEWF